MKQTIILLTCVGLFFCMVDAMDDYTALELVTLDHSDSESEEHPSRSILTMWQGGVRTENQALNVSKQQLTSVKDLAGFRISLHLATLTSLNTCKGYLGSDDLCTIVREIPTLTFLNAGYNRIKTLKEIPIHEKLETLLLNNNKVADFDANYLFTQLPSLRKLALHNNKKLRSDLINISSGNFHRNIEELWFDHDALTPAQITVFITTCPQLSSELFAGNRTVQKYYSKIEQQYDDHDRCRSGRCCGNRDRVCSNPCSYFLIPLGGAVAGLTAAAIISTAQYPHAKQQEIDAFGYYCAILIPTLAISFLISYRLMYRLCCYLKTKPEDRYKTVHTRPIAAQPQLLNLIEDNIDPIPAQEE